MTLEERIEALSIAVAEELNSRKKQAAPLNIQRGRVVFNDAVLKNDLSGWTGLLNGAIANSSVYNIRFKKPFKKVPVVTLAQQRTDTPSWRFIEIVTVTEEMFSIRCNYWGNNLILHWMAMEEETA
ncbi:hypothetical protein EGK75_07575 [Neisseria weixii]|uniref:H-type lectin domain-containing protein n=1 Tax=Neisseria weixii TaxID=1853276 RepID=A0A3N4N2I6_9NEIS|nr:H-type lectin domain-containing protein [Neisseria weixii]RPD86230.1 hypothetical protein EGK74_08290 [Neisseria weixii]RPD87214.1 hypothetical protein EGK75_07575 [Neisseria weixii]